MTFYSGPHAVVTSTRLVVSGTTYAMSQIVSVTAVALPKSPLPIGLGLALVVSGGVVSLFGFPSMALVPGILLFAIGVLLLIVHLRILRQVYAVVTQTSSGSITVLTSDDWGVISGVAGAISHAIVSRR